MLTDPTNIDPAHADLLAKAKAALAAQERLEPFNERADAWWKFHRASQPAAIINLITQLGDARAEAESQRKNSVRVQLWMTRTLREHGIEIGVPPKLPDADAELVELKRLRKIEGRYEHLKEQVALREKALAARGTAAGEGDSHD